MSPWPFVVGRGMSRCGIGRDEQRPSDRGGGARGACTFFQTSPGERSYLRAAFDIVQGKASTSLRAGVSNPS